MNFSSSVENRSGGANMSGGNVTGDVVGRDKKTATAGEGGTAIVAETATVTVNQNPLNALVDLLQKNPAARVALGKYRTEVKRVSLAIQELAAYKTLHDSLHNVQLNCYDMLVVMTSDDLRDRRKRRTLESYAQTVGETIETAKKCCPPVRPRHVRWINDLLEAQTSLLTGANSAVTAVECRERAISILQRVLTEPPSTIDQTIFDLADRLPLKDTLDIFGELLPFLRGLPSEAFNTTAFESGLRGLQGFEVRLQALVTAHDTWQKLIDDVRNVSDQSESGFGFLQQRWPKLSDEAQAACGPEMIALAATLDTPESIAKSLTEITAKITALTSALQVHEANDIQEAFEDFWRQVNLVFKRIDDNLKKACDQLGTVAAEPLAKIDELMAA